MTHLAALEMSLFQASQILQTGVAYASATQMAGIVLAMSAASGKPYLAKDAQPQGPWQLCMCTSACLVNLVQELRVSQGFVWRLALDKVLLQGSDQAIER